LSNSGAIELIAKLVIDSSRSLFKHIFVMSGVAALLSAVMNNVAALALLMPIDMQAADKGERNPALSLMPLSFASILGGMITLIGTPPNIIIASFREQALGEPYSMFDFSPVGFVVAAVGIIFIVLVGWRLIPVSDSKGATNALSNLQDYIAEVKVGEKSTCIGKQIFEIESTAEEADVAIIGLVRAGKRHPGSARSEHIEAGDILVIEAKAPAIDALVGALKLEYVGSDQHKSVTGEGTSLIEVVVPEGARIEGRSALGVQLLYRHGVTLLGVSRQGKSFRDRVRKLQLRAGDVLLLLGGSERVHEIANWMGCLPLEQRDLQVIQRDKAWIAVAAFAGAISAATVGWLHLPEALAIVCLIMIMTNIIPLREIYTSVEWPVIVLLGSMIPIGIALERAGGTALLAEQIVDIAAAYGPVVVLSLLMIVTMTLSDVLNNTATAVIAAPIAVDVANRLNASPDPFLMAVAVAASCAFLTPIGHKNNTLIMGPGGYRFGDYWRMGLPLEILVIAVSIPTIVWVWPL
ncbi:MAG: SLC13 family permease, partial [Pseudomonadota bacterium]